MVLHALIDTVKEEIVLTGTEEEVCKYMDFIIKVFGKNDLAKVNRFEVIAGDPDAVLNFFNFEPMDRETVLLQQPDRSTFKFN